MFAHFLPDKNNKIWKELLLTCFILKKITSSEKNIKPVDSSVATVVYQNLNQKHNLHPVDGRNPAPPGKTTNLNWRVCQISSINSPFPSPFPENWPDSKLGVGDDNWPPIVPPEFRPCSPATVFFPGSGGRRCWFLAFF